MTRLIIWGVLLIGLMLTFSGTWNSKVHSEQLEELDFRASCNDTERLIAHRLDHQARILWSGAALFSASDHVTRREWHRFTQQLRIERQLPGIQGYGFAELIPREALAQHTQEIRNEGFPEYQVRPAGERELYTSIIYLEPFSGRNLRAFGYDMFSEPVRRAAMERARDTDAAALSGKVILVQETDQEVQFGALMYVPVYRNGLPTATAEERRAAIIGWVYSPYRMNDLFLGILGEHNRNLKKGLRLSIFDGEQISPESCLFAVSSAREAVAAKRQLEKQLRIEYNGHGWTLLFRQAKSSFGSLKYASAWVTLGGGIACTLLLCLLLRVLLDTRRKAQQLAERMTADLQKSKESLLRTTERLSLAVRAGGIGIWDLDVSHNRLDCDEQMFRLYGLTPGPFANLHETWQARIHPEDRPRVDESIQLALRGEKEYDDDFRILWPDGTVRYIRGFASVLRDGSGKALHMIGTNWDMTETKRSEDSIKRQAGLINALLDSMPDLIFFKDLEGRYLGCNPNFLTFVGMSKEALLGKTDYELFAQRTAEGFRANDHRVLELRELRHNEEWITYPDGRKILVDMLKTPYWGPDGEMIGILGISRDITARKHTERELARLSVIQRALMRLATKFVNVPLERQEEAIDQSLETMGRVIHADRAYLFSYDFEAGVMTNTHEWCQEGIPPEIDNLQSVPTERFRDWVTSHQAGECILIPSVDALPKESDLRQILAPQGVRSLITLPLMQDSVCLGFVGFDAVQQERHWKEEEVALLQVLAELYAHFESRRKMERETQELQKRLTEARDAAQEAARAKSLFLANMSHEIRTPLNVILGYTQIMERECRVQACPMSKKLGAITRSGEHLLELLNDLLELVRSDTQEVKLATGVFDFYQALEDVRLIFVRHPAAQVLTLQVSHEPEVPRFICSDSGKVRQVLVNLVDNALKFTERGGVRLSAALLSGRAAEILTLAVDVEDSGCGMRPEEQEHLFELFYTHTERGGKAPKGTGLGLALSRRYARALGGDVTLIRSTSAGSCFRFTFQIRAADPSALEQRHTGVVRRLAPNQPPFRVLVVDDDPANREIIVGLLEPLGITVETDSSAENALNRLRQDMAFDLILMDKRMPEMDGYEAIRQLREMPGGKKIAVLVVSASGDADERASALAAGANGYLSKPVHRDILLEEIACVTGLQYEYDPQKIIIPQEKPIFDAEALSHVPDEMCRLLSQALQRGDIKQLRGLVEILERDHAALASGIRIFVDAYDYDRLRHLIEARGEAQNEN